MIDLSKIGNAGLIIQYEDIVSLYGFNVLKYFKEKHLSDKLDSMSNEDLVLSYINRTTFDVSDWIQQEFNLTIDPNMDSPIMWKPNMLYAYKMFDTAYKNGVTKLTIHSNSYIPSIEKYIQSFQLPVQYTHGDIVPVLKQLPNVTYTTSDPNNIRSCLHADVPFVLTIVDDFVYVSEIIKDKVDDALRKKNIFVFYTGIISAGITGYQT
jgi:hypothetical protein